MNNDETHKLLMTINRLWPQRPMDAEAMKLVGGLIAGHDFAAALSAVKQLATTEEWFHVSKLLKMLKPAPSALEAFQKTLSIVNICAPDQRDQNAPDAIRATVARLGGWRAVGQMRIDGDERKWAEKRWAEAWEEVHAEIAAGRPMAELLPQPRLGLVAGAVAAALTKGGE